MALPLLNDFNEGTSGTALTVANTAGSGENAFDSVAGVGSGSTAAFSNAQSLTGGMSAVFATGSAGNSSYVSWTTSIGSVSTIYGRAYLYLSALPATDDNLIHFAGSGSNGGGIMIGSSGQLRLQNVAFGETTTGPVLSAGTWFRLEWKIIAGSAGSAAATVNYYASPNSTTITSTITDTAGGYGSGGVITQVDFGWESPHPSQPSVYFDSIGLASAGYLGPAPTTVSGAAGLAGSGSMGAAWQFEETAALSGSGTLGGAGVAALLAGAALTGSGAMTALGTGGNVASVTALSGAGSLSGTGQVWLFQAGMSGAGSMTVVGGATYLQYATLSGTGLLSAGTLTVKLSGVGILGVSGEALGFAIGLSGLGALSVPQVIGGLVSGVGGAAAPQALPGSSQVSVAPPGSANWQWIGTLGQVTALSYGYICPGGCDQMTMTVMVPAAYRTQLFNPGWQVRITRGGHQVWDGKLDEPVPSAGGWTLTAVGTGNLGTNFLANYTDAWPGGEPDESVNNAISRGLPWVNPGIGSPSGMWLGQEVDTGAQTVTALLTLVCTRGGLTWYVNSQPGGVIGDNLSVFTLPATPTRLLVCTTPVARTLGGDINTIFIKYMTAADNATSGAAAAYSLTSVQNAQDVAAHQATETYIDLSDVGVMSQAAAQAVGSSVLQIYQRASFAGPFTAAYGQLLTTGGQAIDPGTDQAGTVVQLILTDFGYGGEVTPQFPVTFVVGAYSWDDFAQVATITPYQNVDQSLTGMLSMDNTVMTPIAAAS